MTTEARISYRINDREYWVDVNEYEGNDLTGRHWWCDTMAQAEDVRARLTAGLSAWDGPTMPLIDPMDDCNESFWRGVALAGEWDDDRVPF